MSSAPKSQRIRVYEYRFEVHVTHCKVKVNFPCAFFLKWNTGSISERVQVVRLSRMNIQLRQSKIPSHSTVDSSSRWKCHTMSSRALFWKRKYSG